MVSSSWCQPWYASSISCVNTEILDRMLMNDLDDIYNAGVYLCMYHKKKGPLHRAEWRRHKARSRDPQFLGLVMTMTIQTWVRVSSANAAALAVGTSSGVG